MVQKILGNVHSLFRIHVEVFKKNMNASKPSEHPPSGGIKCLKARRGNFVVRVVQRLRGPGIQLFRPRGGHQDRPFRV